MNTRLLLINRYTVGRIMPSPQNVYILIHRTCEYVTLHGKKNLEVMIKLKILTYGEIIVKYPSGPNIITSVLIVKKGGRSIKEGNMTKEAEIM